ncbi:gastrin/cholecystokinin type B receptor-like [Gigantopelta aegis]|uniref:gastrin/cholecystokinin type B receptor-like n=1 Tax=Gigantopelta aegis TaxID=1735272 RepID=UPI001B88DFA3|nr:gastrin/cholecystokinin type B receptor-like [Gigantopelta aegis]
MEENNCHLLNSDNSNVSHLYNLSEYRNCNGSGSGERGQMPVIPTYLLVATTSLYIIIFISGTVGNILVVAAVGLERSMRTSTNVFLVNLALADLMVILIALPTALTEVFAEDEWYFGNVMCKLVPILENSVAHASVLTMLVIAVERFQAVCYPLTLRNKKVFSITIKWVTIAVVWLVSFICCLPFLYIAVYRDSRYLDGTPIKVCRQYMKYSWQKVYVTILFVVFFAIPLCIMAVLYGFVILKLKQKSGVLYKEKNETSSRVQNARNKVIIMSITITVLFFILHAPLRIAGMWMTFTRASNIDALGFEGFWNLICIIRVMFYVNSCVNPIVYGIVSSKFRREFWKICCMKRLYSRRADSWGSSRMLSVSGRPISQTTV